MFAESGAEIIAEDLGVIPDFVRESLARLAIPGYRVFRWERHWKKENQPFRDPLEYSPVSVATSGTHDTEPLVMVVEQALEGERQAVMDIPSMRDRLTADERARTVRKRRSRPRFVPCCSMCLCVRIGSGDPASAGRVRLAGPDQSTGDRQRLELDLEAAVAKRSAVVRACGSSRRRNSCVRARPAMGATRSTTPATNGTAWAQPVRLFVFADPAHRVFQRDGPIEDRAARPRIRIGAEVALRSN